MLSDWRVMILKDMLFSQLLMSYFVILSNKLDSFHEISFFSHYMKFKELKRISYKMTSNKYYHIKTQIRYLIPIVLMRYKSSIKYGRHLWTSLCFSNQSINQSIYVFDYLHLACSSIVSNLSVIQRCDAHIMKGLLDALSRETPTHVARKRRVNHRQITAVLFQDLRWEKQEVFIVYI